MQTTQTQTEQPNFQTARQIEETNRQMKDYNKWFREFSNRFGDVAEYMIAPNLMEKFKDFGFEFNQSSSNYRVEDEVNDIFFGIDVFLQNDDTAMLVEVRTKLYTEDVKDHIKLLKEMRTFADLRGNKRAFLGAVAGVVMTPPSQKVRAGSGFFRNRAIGGNFQYHPSARQATGMVKDG